MHHHSCRWTRGLAGACGVFSAAAHPATQAGGLGLCEWLCNKSATNAPGTTPPEGDGPILPPEAPVSVTLSPIQSLQLRVAKITGDSDWSPSHAACAQGPWPRAPTLNTNVRVLSVGPSIAAVPAQPCSAAHPAAEPAGGHRSPSGV